MVSLTEQKRLDALKRKLMDDYFPTKEEGKRRAICMNLGYKCYAKLTENKANSLMILMAEFPNRKEPIASKNPPFESKYLSYYVNEFYKEIFKRLKTKT